MADSDITTQNNTSSHQDDKGNNDTQMTDTSNENVDEVVLQKNVISTSTTGEEGNVSGKKNGDENDDEDTDGREGGGRGGGSGNSGRYNRGGRGGRYNRRGGYGRGGRGGRGRNQRRHNPYNNRNYNSGGGNNNDNNDENMDGNNDNERGRRVYVGNLSWDVAWTDLKDHMKSTGCEVIRADVITSHDGRSKGCGIVEFATADFARRAVLTLNDTELMGRQIFVREDREDAQGGGGGGSAGGGGGASAGGGRGGSAGGGGGGSAGGEGGGSVEDGESGSVEDGGSSSVGGGGSSGGGEAQSRRCYVGNLSWDVAWQDLKDHMRSEGDVVYAEVMSEPDGRSKGCGIVEYATPEEAQSAIANLTDTELKGRMIFVREDRETGSGSGGGATSGDGNNRQSSSVYVGNLAFETSWQDLKDHMRGAGNVEQANILQGDDGRSKGCGIVLYQKPQDAQRAIRELHNSELHNRPILVREDREQGSGGGGGGGFRRGGGHHNSGGGGGGGGSGGTQLFVGNLSFDTTWRELKDHFRQCGDVERAEVMEGPDGRRKGFGTVKFYKQKDASNAIRRLNGNELQGRNLEVRLDHKAN